MQLLLDTHALIWLMSGDRQLSKKAEHAIRDSGNSCFVSIASIWEIAIKISIGRLEINGEFIQINNFIQRNSIEILPVDFFHLQNLINMPFNHRDPFDRIIIAQAQKENLTIVSKDNHFENYPVETLWN